MLPAVVIDVPPDLTAAAALTVVQRCEHVLGRGRCRLADEAADAERRDVGYYAFIRHEDSESATFEIEFRADSASGALLARRTLAFSDGDAPESRWASAGLVVAGLVAAADIPPPPPSSPRPKSPPPSPPLPRPMTAWGIDAGVLTGPGLRRGPYRLGAFARGWLELPRVPALIGAAAVRYAVVSDEPSPGWFTVSGGLGARLGARDSPVTAELLGELVVERVLITAEEPETGRTDSGGQNRFGGRVGVSFAVRMSTELRFLAGAELAALTPPTSIEVQSEVVGNEPVARFALTAGLRLGF